MCQAFSFSGVDPHVNDGTMSYSVLYEQHRERMKSQPACGTNWLRKLVQWDAFPMQCRWQTLSMRLGTGSRKQAMRYTKRRWWQERMNERSKWMLVKVGKGNRKRGCSKGNAFSFLTLRFFAVAGLVFLAACNNKQAKPHQLQCEYRGTWGC